MKLLEYEAKQLLKENGIAVPYGVLIKSKSMPLIKLPTVLKSQVPVGGRGKAGGVVAVTTKAELRRQKEALLQLSIKGFRPQVLLAEEKVIIKREHYLALFIDRATSSIRLMAHSQGGINVEDNTNSSLFNETIDLGSGASVASKVAIFLGYDRDKLTSLIQKLFTVFVQNDAILLEVNPLILKDDDTFVCGDCKMELDDAAAFRHPEWDFEDTPKDTNFVVLNAGGNIATIANGAGLAMATVDAVAANDMIPANFLDIGGGATTASVLAAFKKIQEFPNIQAVVINIFAGITRCDQIAQAIIEARQHITALPPVFLRLAGTNFEEAAALLAAEDIPTLGTLEDCLKAAKRTIYA